MNVKKETYNKLLKRKELVIDLEHSGKATMSKTDLQNTVASDYKTEAGKVEVVDIFTDVGIAKSVARVFVWDEKILKKNKKPKKEEVKK